MTTTLLENTPKEILKREEPLAEFEPFGPGFVGEFLADMGRFAEESTQCLPASASSDAGSSRMFAARRWPHRGSEHRDVLRERSHRRSRRTPGHDERGSQG